MSSLVARDFVSAVDSAVDDAHLLAEEVVTAHDGPSREALHLYFHIEQLKTIRFLFTCGTSL